MTGKAADVSQFVKSASDCELEQLDAAVKEAEAKVVINTLDEALCAIKCGTLDPASVRSALYNWKYEKERQERLKREEEEEAAEQAKLEAVKNSPEFVALVARMKAIKAEYEGLGDKEFTVKFTVPVTATVTLNEEQDFTEFFQNDFQGDVDEITDIYSVGDFKLVLSEGHNFTGTQVESVQTALHDLVENYDCELVTAMFPGVLKVVNDLYQRAKAVAIEYDKLTEGQFDIEELVGDDE